MTKIELMTPGALRSITIEAEPGQKLSAAIWLSGKLTPVPLCNGLGLCGRCRCRFVENAPTPVADELRYFDGAQIAAGWRLACRHSVPNQACLKLELPEPVRSSQGAGSSPPAPGPAANMHPQPGNDANAPHAPATPAFLGVDLGTTSIQWQAVNSSRQTLAQGSLWNPQGGAGADIISRIQLALDPGGKAKLSHLALGAMAAVLERLECHGVCIERACVAANTAMTEILLQKDTAGLAYAPYHASFAGGETSDLTVAGFPPLPTVFPPLPAPFVGGDISAGLLALLELHKADPPFMLADLGTNAELALLTENNILWLASAPLGPAMEGIGPQCGQPPGPGVITAFNLSPTGLAAQISPPASHVAGISATGYISLLAILLKTGILAPDGNLQANTTIPLTAKISANLTAGRLHLPHEQFIDAFDIELLLKVKAALALAIDQLLTAAMPAARLRRLYLAGALGQHADIADLATLGFIPQNLAAKTVACGNTSLAGACILAVNPQKLPQLAKLCAHVRILDPANDPNYLKHYLQAMRWGQQYAI